MNEGTVKKESSNEGPQDDAKRISQTRIEKAQEIVGILESIGPEEHSRECIYTLELAAKLLFPCLTLEVKYH